MNFLNPMAIGVAAALTIPPLVALYFLKLKRNVRSVSSTLLWKRAVEDLQVNAPFQKLRSSLLLILQLLILIAAAVALGQPMFQTAQRYGGTIIILVDQSASMGIIESDGRSRLAVAKEQSKLRVDNMRDDARAMVIAFCDRATVVASFDTDKASLKRKIDSIEPTQSLSSLGEALNLAEAYMENIMIGTEEAGGDIAPESAAQPASVFVFSDGRIEDADQVSLKRLDADKIHMIPIGQRGDNVGLLTVDARRNYEHPEVLEVTATVRNFSEEPFNLDAVLYVDGSNVDVKTIQLQPAGSADGETSGSDSPARGSVQVLAFDEIEFEGGGVIEVVLRVDDALSADDRAWVVVDPPRHLSVLLVTPGSIFLENVLSTLPLDLLVMTGAEYEDAADQDLTQGRRSAFDVVIFDRHSTARLPQGNYFFWGAIPQIEGLTSGKIIDDQVIFNWDDTHPILRHVSVETLFVYEWLELKLPPESISLIDGETTPVLAYLTREASQFLISAFSLTVQDELGNSLLNAPWATSADFVVFMQNALGYLGANLTVTGSRSVSPGDPATLPFVATANEATILRPDGTTDRVSPSAHQAIHYARTRQVGIYRVDGGVEGRDVFAVNLFNPTESFVKPIAQLTLGADAVESRSDLVEVNDPAWPYVLLVLLALLLLEWIVYNRRVLM